MIKIKESEMNSYSSITFGKLFQKKITFGKLVLGLAFQYVFTYSVHVYL